MNDHVLVITAGHVPEGALSEPVTEPGHHSYQCKQVQSLQRTSPIHSTVVFSGGAAKTGAVWSSTVIVCEAVAVLPQASVNVHVLVITAGHVPEGAESSTSH